MKKVFVFIFLICIYSCKQQEYIVLTKIEKEYVDRIRYDSVFVERYIALESKNDTLYITITNTEYKYKYINTTDTLYNIDTINTTLILYVDKETTNYKFISIIIFLFLLSLLFNIKHLFEKNLL